MSDTSSRHIATPSPPAAADASLRSMAILCYGLLLAAAIVGVTAIIALIIAYIKKDDAAGTVWQSHYRNAIVVFWVMFAALAIGVLTWPLSLGLFFAGNLAWTSVSFLSLPFLFWFAIFPILCVWFLYRTIRGLVHATDNRAY